MKYRYILALFTLFLISCSGEPTNTENKVENVDPHHAAIPDSETNIESELSEADKKKLAEANGIEAEEISLSVLSANLQHLKSTTALCYFWSVTKGNSKASFEHLKKLSSQAASDKLAIIIVHMESGEYAEEVNAIIREHGIDAETYLLKDADALENLPGTEDKWDGQLPIYYVYNKEDGTGLWIDGNMDYAELYVMIQPFIM